MYPLSVVYLLPICYPYTILRYVRTSHPVSTPLLLCFALLIDSFIDYNRR